MNARYRPREDVTNLLTPRRKLDYSVSIIYPEYQSRRTVPGQMDGTSIADALNRVQLPGGAKGPSWV
jgi:hypothetical protein